MEEESGQIKNFKIRTSFWSYFSLFAWPIICLIGSIFMFYAINYSDTIITRADRHPFGENVIASAFFLISILGLIKTRNFFQLTPIFSKLSISKKIEVLNEVKTVLNFGKITEGEFSDFRFIYSGPWYTSFTVDVVIFIDQNGFYINVRDWTNFPYFFAFTNSTRRKIIDQIEITSKYF